MSCVRYGCLGLLSSSERRGQPRTWAVLMVLEIAHSGAVCRDVLYGASVEGSFLCDVVLSEQPQEVQSLLCLFQHLRGVHAPGQIFFNMDTPGVLLKSPRHRKNKGYG